MLLVKNEVDAAVLVEGVSVCKSLSISLDWSITSKFASRDMRLLSIFSSSGRAKSTTARSTLTAEISNKCFVGNSLIKMRTQKSLIKPYNPTNITFIIECLSTIN